MVKGENDKMSVFEVLKEKWTAPFIKLTDLEKLTNGVLKSCTLRALKSKGEGIQGSQLLGRNTIYPIDEVILWLDENIKIIDERDSK